MAAKPGIVLRDGVGTKGLPAVAVGCYGRRMRAAATLALSIVGALLLPACAESCDRAREGTGAAGSAARGSRLDYAPLLKASGDAIAANFAGHLGVAPSALLEPGSGARRDGGDDREVYAVANGGRIDVHFDRSRQPLWVQYRGPAECLGRSGRGEKPIAPAEANAAVLALLRRMGLAVDDTARVESQLHDDGLVWIGVYVWQTYRGEVIERPSVFALVDGITSRVCELRVPRWYAGVALRGPPLARDALLAHARAAGARLPAGRQLGSPTLGALMIVGDMLCREVRFAGSSDASLCLDVVTGNATDRPS